MISSKRRPKQPAIHLHRGCCLRQELIAGLLTNEPGTATGPVPADWLRVTRQMTWILSAPGDYRDADLEEYGACFCSLYVSDAVAKGERMVSSIPERRPAPEETNPAT